MLAQCYENEGQGNIGLQQVGELKVLIAGAELSDEYHWQHRKQMDRRVLHPQRAKDVALIRDKQGLVVTDPLVVAEALRKD